MTGSCVPVMALGVDDLGAFGKLVSLDPEVELVARALLIGGAATLPSAVGSNGMRDSGTGSIPTESLTQHPPLELRLSERTDSAAR